MQKIPHLLLCVILIGLSSCANYRLNVLSEEKNWPSIQTAPEEELEHTVFLIGDAGNSPEGEMAPPLILLKRKLDKAGKNSAVIFLGDNIYPDGLPPKSERKDRKLGEHRLDAQLQILDNFSGRPIFIPGNHDWRRYGLKGLRRQEKYIEKHLNKGIEEEDDWENYFLPDRGCSGPEIVELGPNLVVVVIDSQWWLADWDKEPEINDGCEAKSRKVFSFIFEELVRKNRNKNVIIAMHHPLYTNGTHGGNFTPKQHLFPLTDLNDNLFVPLPVVGSAVSFLRGVVGSRQDVAHQSYKDMKETIMAAAKKNGNFIFASGHEHSLQYFENDNQAFVVSGSGSKKSPTRLGNGAHFAYGHPGFSQLKFYKDGSAWVEFWTTDEENVDGKLVYRKKIRGALKSLEYSAPTDFPEYEQKQTEKMSKVLTTKVDKKGGVHNVLLGAHYRDLYLPDYRFEVLDLATHEGGMTPVKRGGGNQTNSLRLKDAKGRQWSLRSMTKDASRFIPYPFNKITAAQSIVEDNFLSTHPFAALAVPVMADAVNVYHTNPRLYYMAKQPALGVYNDIFGGGVYLLEERPSDGWEDRTSFGQPEKFISTPDVTEKLAKNHNHRIDQNWVVKSRLFDMVIGDWDRHDDQWRWAVFKDGDIKTYRPIPRDRDQPFSKYDGLFTGVARLTLPFLKQLKEYREDPGNAKWANYNARQFDKTFMNAMEWEDWAKEVRAIQEKLTDEVVEKAFAVWPEPAREQSKRLQEIVKYRRDNLLDIARAHYELLAREVHVAGTNDRDYFLIERLDDNKMRVRIYETNKKREKKSLYYDRTFLTAETKDVALFGMNDDDYFEISGSVDKGILVRIIGGLDDDEVVDRSKVSGGSKKTWVYDSMDKGNELDLGQEGRDRRSNNRELNIYNRKDYHYEYDFVMPFPILGFNPDDGLFLGTNMTFINYKFKKSPYGQIHQLNGQFAFATGAYNIAYLGDYLETFGKWDFLLDVQLQAPQYVVNFFGLGNESMRDEERSINFYRVRKSLYRLNPSFKKRIAAGSGSFIIGPVLERIKVEDTDDRFIVSDAANLPDQVFESRNYGGVDVRFNYENLDNLQMTTRGISFLSGIEWKTDLADSDISFARLQGSLTIYQSFTPKDRIVLATRIGGGHNFGDFPFHQAHVLGGRTNMRGFRGERFYGGSSFFHNTDLRLKLFNIDNSVLPFSLGVLGGFDYGRVWLDGEEGDNWHSSYGGGIWIAPIDFIVISTNLFISEEDQRFTVGIGFGF